MKLWHEGINKTIYPTNQSLTDLEKEYDFKRSQIELVKDNPESKEYKKLYYELWDIYNKIDRILRG